MTLLEIIETALKQMGEDTDAAAMDEYKGLLTRYVNEAYMEIVRQKLRLIHTETVTFGDFKADAASLSRDLFAVVKIEKEDGANVPFKVSGGVIYALNADGELSVSYYYLPEALSEDTDVPETPEMSHMCMADYATFRGLLLGGSGSRDKAEVFIRRYLNGFAGLGTQSFHIRNKY